MSDETFLSRWSRKKHESASTTTEPAGPPADTVAMNAGPGAGSPAAPPAAHGVPAAPPLPPVETLTPQSDFAPFMRPEIEDTVKRKALKTLFQDPRFNVMDGLDVYIDDYSKPDPLPEGWLEKLNQVARLGDSSPVEAKGRSGQDEPVDAPAKDAVAEAGEQQAGPENSSDTGAEASSAPEVKE